MVHAESMPKDTVAEGVFIEQLDLSGMTISEAVNAVDDYIAGKTASKIRLNINDNWVEAVSYTHLDVYKRQALNRALHQL